MTLLTLSKTGFTASVCAVLSAICSPVYAESIQDSIFSKVEPSVRDRMFFRLGYIHVNTKSTSGETYDVTGPVVTKAELANIGTLFPSTGTNSMFYTGSGPRNPNYALLLQGVPGAMDTDGDLQGCDRLHEGLGTPCGVRGRSQATLGTPALSVGYFLDAEYKWALEAFVLAAPLNASVYAEGPVSLSGKKVLETKLLPPTALLGYYFGKKDAKLRPYVGVGASYAIFFDTRATNALNEYVGGKTSIQTENAVGFGPFVGLKTQLTDDWHFNLSIGKIRFKTEATLTTRDTVITSSSAVLQDYGSHVTSAISIGNSTQVKVRSSDSPDGYQANDQVALTTALMCDLAKLKYGNNSCNHGTFVRKQKMDLDNTLFMLSVGRSF